MGEDTDKHLRDLLQANANRYDYCVIDCPPHLGLLMRNALTAADSVLIPIQTEYLAARGAFMIMSTIETVRRKRLNPDLEIEGILLTMADTRTNLSKDVRQAIEQQFGNGYRIFDPVIKRSVRFGESAVAGQSILAYDPKGQGAEAYVEIARQILNQTKS